MRSSDHPTYTETELRSEVEHLRALLRSNIAPAGKIPENYLSTFNAGLRVAEAFINDGQYSAAETALRQVEAGLDGAIAEAF